MPPKQALPLVIPARAAHTVSVIFVHGLGDSGHGWSFFPELAAAQNRLAQVKWILPNAPIQPVTLNGGVPMPSWYDILSLDRINAREDETGMLASVSYLHGLVDKEVDDGKKVVVAGFSQGSAMSLLAGLTYKRPLAGIVGLSGYLPLRQKAFGLRADANKNTPIWMGHGTADPVVNFEYGKQSADLLKENGHSVDFNAYRGLGHSADPKEIGELMSFIEKVVSE
ncbi:hypothetical protein PYCC9005_005619 [Savitreella phatthalungensis]